MPLFMCQNGTLGVARFIVDSHDSHVGQRLMLMMKDNGYRNMCINLCGWMHVMMHSSVWAWQHELVEERSGPANSERGYIPCMQPERAASCHS